MTERIYDNNSNIYEFEAVVTNVEEINGLYGICLDKTCFFPGGGGQERDFGIIDNTEVTDIYEKDGFIFHVISENKNIGQLIKGKIDFEKRFKNMQNHSGEHLVTGIIHNLYGFDNIGFHMGSECITLDINGDLTDAQLLNVEYLANKAIYENKNITVSYPSFEELKNLEYRSKLDLKENVRIVTIEDYDNCACCAPHVTKTGEIGIIKIIGKEKLKDKLRVRMLRGYDAYSDYVKKFENAQKISVLLSVKPNETFEAVDKLYKELNEKNYEITGIKRELYALKYSSLKEDGNIIVFEDDTQINELIYIANILSENNNGYICVLSEIKSGGFNYVIKNKNVNLRDKIKEINSLLNGRGGGKEEMVQGFFNSDKKDVEKVLTNL